MPIQQSTEDRTRAVNFVGNSGDSSRSLLLNHSRAEVFIPDQQEPGRAFDRVTHLGIVSHQDDLEVATFHGIAECFRSEDKWFGGVVVTNGAGSPRCGPYAKYTDAEMQAVRRLEQRKAAFLGEYGFMVQLGYPSPEVKFSRHREVADDIEQILRLTNPQYVYLHNPADRHDTHVATFLRSLEALRALPMSLRPMKVYGCEVWRKLDWLVKDDKVSLPVDQHPHLLGALLGAFDSQISGGKRYDLAESGQRQANATYGESHATDQADALSFAMDLTPLIDDDSIDPEEFVIGHVERLSMDILTRLRKYA